jgi:drug/metabolite transporter (DMT)-like permease
MKILSNYKLGALYAIMSGFCYSLLGYFGITIIQAGLSVYNMLFWRFLVSALFALVLLIPKYPIIFQSPRISLQVLLSGMVFYGSSSIVFFLSSLYIGTGLAMVIFFIYPAIVMIINIIFYNAKFSKIYFLAFLIILIGLVLLIDIQDCRLDILGVVLGVGTAMFYACYMVASEKISIHPILSTVMVSIGSAAICFIASLVDSSFHIPSGLSNWLNIIGIGLLCTAIPILLILKALKYIDAEKAATLSVLEPVFVLIFGIILLGEKITFIQGIGTIIVLFGALMVLFHTTAKTKY